ncbi:MAG: septum formation protein Maf [Clostridia bacterium]|nr:septum formation protein Maf [Clostridia bacterium]
MRIVLASKSPRRREILTMLGVKFDIVTADTDEHSTITDPAALVEELALRKGRAVRELLQARGEWNNDTLIIASDTVVAAGCEILGKPEDEADAARMLRALQGSAHHVISGIALIKGEKEIADHDKTAVHFSPMTEEEILWYATSGEPLDKAGAYAVQGLASLFIKGLSGDYFNVVGLPVYRLNQLTKQFVGKSLTEL